MHIYAQHSCIFPLLHCFLLPSLSIPLFFLLSLFRSVSLLLCFAFWLPFVFVHPDPVLTPCHPSSCLLYLSICATFPFSTILFSSYKSLSIPLSPPYITIYLPFTFLCIAVSERESNSSSLSTFCFLSLFSYHSISYLSYSLSFSLKKGRVSFSSLFASVSSYLVFISSFYLHISISLYFSFIIFSLFPF